MNRQSPNRSRTSAPEDQLLHSLRETVDSPDLTRRIMGRVGFMRSTPGVSFRRYRGRLLRRGGWCIAFFLIVAAAIQIHVQRIGLPAEGAMPLPQAVGHDISRQRDCIFRALETIRRAAPESSTLRQLETISPEVDSSAVGPVRWL